MLRRQFLGTQLIAAAAFSACQQRSDRADVSAADPEKSTARVKPDPQANITVTKHSDALRFLWDERKDEIECVELAFVKLNCREPLGTGALKKSAPLFSLGRTWNVERPYPDGIGMMNYLYDVEYKIGDSVVGKWSVNLEERSIDLVSSSLS